MKNIIDYSKTNLYTFSEKRFNNVERLTQKSLCDLTFDEYDELWKKAKKITSEQN